MTKYASQRNATVDYYISAFEPRKELNFLFITHAHADHINGVPRLLDPLKGLKVDTIIMPHFNLEERLIAYARTNLEDVAAASSEFYKAFVANPLAAVSRFNPGRIIFIESGNRGGGAPYSLGPDSGGQGPDNFRLLELDTDAWKISGRGSLRKQDFFEEETDVPAVVMEDTLGITLSDSSGAAWLLAPYIDPAVKSARRDFMTALAQELKMSTQTLRRRASNTEFLKTLLTEHESDLRAAYSTFEKDLNITSLCIYSGPAAHITDTSKVEYIGIFGENGIRDIDANRLAWLGTGDAALKNRTRRSAFFKHYGALLDNVVTLTLPHHGSDHNFDGELVAKVQPRFCVAAADRYSTWRHPGSAVVQEIASNGRFVSVVTSDVRSVFQELVDLP